MLEGLKKYHTRMRESGLLDVALVPHVIGATSIATGAYQIVVGKNPEGIYPLLAGFGLESLLFGANNIDIHQR